MGTLRNIEIDNARSSLTARTKSKQGRNQEFRRGLPQIKAEIQMFLLRLRLPKGHSLLVVKRLVCRHDLPHGREIHWKAHVVPRKGRPGGGKTHWRAWVGQSWSTRSYQASRYVDLANFTKNNSLQIPGREIPFSLNVLLCSSSALYWQS